MEKWQSWPEGRKDLVGALTALLVTLLVYGASLGNGFIDWDDRPLIVENTAIRSLSPSNVWQLFVPRSGETYQPLRELSYALDYAVWDYQAFGYHLHNTLLHGVAGGLFFLLICRVLRRFGRDDEWLRWTALAASLIWVVHPVNVEAVAWASSRKYGLLGCFTMACLHAFLFYRDTRSWKWLLTTVGCAVLATLSSPFGIVIPAVVALWHHCLGQERNPLHEWRKCWPLYAAFAVTYAGIVLLLRASLMSDNSAVSQFEHSIPLHHAVFTLFWTAGDYASNLLAPWTVSALYPPYVVASPFKLKILIALSLAGGAGYFMIRTWRNGNRLPTLAIGWAVLAWGPAANVIMVTKADRYLYVPSAGLILAICLGLRALNGRYLKWGIVLVLLLAGLSGQRARLWGNPIGLWTDCLEKHPSVAIAQFNLGNALQTEERFEEAATCYAKCERLQPDYVPMHLSFGILCQRLEQSDEAVRHFSRVVELGAPDQRRQALGLLAMESAKRREWDKATRYFEQWGAAANSAEPYLEAGKTFGRMGEFVKALGFLERAHAMAPGLPGIDRLLGGAYAMTGNLEQAEKAFHRALERDPNDGESASNLAKLQARKR